MAGTTMKAVGSFALESEVEDNKIRIFAEHDGQRFSISIAPIDLAKQFPDRPLKPICEFDFQGVMKLAAQSFTGSKEVAEDKFARIKLSGMLLYLASRMGAVDLESE